MKSKREFAWSSRAMTGRTAKGLTALLMALALVFGFASCDTSTGGDDTLYRTVTYSTEHATAPEKLTVTDGTALTADQLPALTESGYTFGGWYDGETKAEAGYKVTKDVTLTAKWTKNTVTPTPDDGEDDGGNTSEATTYTVTFNTDGTETKQTVAEGEKASKPTDPTKTGYTFAGWYNGETAFDFNTAITQNITLTAKWSAITYTITYALDGGTNADANPATYTIETDDITLADASKDGYTFSGWKNANGETVTKITKGTTGNITLTALWTTASGISVTIAPASEIAVTTAEDSSTITLTADEGFTGYSWRIDGELAEDMGWWTSVSEDGTALTLKKEVLIADEAYQISLYATKNGIPYGTQVTVRNVPRS